MQPCYYSTLTCTCSCPLCWPWVHFWIECHIELSYSPYVEPVLQSRFWPSFWCTRTIYCVTVCLFVEIKDLVVIRLRPCRGGGCVLLSALCWEAPTLSLSHHLGCCHLCPLALGAVCWDPLQKDCVFPL